jgi:hypothetical protein
MAEQFPEKEHGIEQTQNQQNKEAVGQLIGNLHRQELSMDDNSPKRHMSLLDLPLVLALKILQDIVNCYTMPGHQPLKLFPLLELRRVHSKSPSHAPSSRFLIRFAQDSSMSN